MTCLGVRLMLDVDQAGFVDRHAVGVAPADVVGELAPTVVALVDVGPVADAGPLGAGLVLGMKDRGADAAGQRRDGGRRGGGFQKFTTSRLGVAAFGGGHRLNLQTVDGDDALGAYGEHNA